MEPELPQYQNILITIYNHPEHFPPTLNAIQEFSKISEEVVVVTRNLVNPSWNYPSNVKVYVAGKFVTVEESIKRSTLSKLLSFHQYKKLLKRKIRETKPAIIVAYDPIALFACYLLRNSYEAKLWYHNHDIFELDLFRKFSLGWWAAKYESKAFSVIDIFTLPSAEREQYFPLDTFIGSHHVLPNLPGKFFYSQFYTRRKQPEGEIKLLYQGEIRKGHGFEELIPNLKNEVCELKISLTLVGQVNADYKETLMALADSFGVLDKLNFYPRMSYTELPAFTLQYDIGLAIHNSKSIQYTTGGTASNKIYEYAALGLPVILFDDEHYRMYLQQHLWAYFTDLSESSVMQCIEQIWNQYVEVSEKAHEDIMNELNFENEFSKVLENVPLKEQLPY